MTNEASFSPPCMEMYWGFELGFTLLRMVLLLFFPLLSSPLLSCPLLSCLVLSLSSLLHLCSLASSMHPSIVCLPPCLLRTIISQSLPCHVSSLR